MMSIRSISIDGMTDTVGDSLIPADGIRRPFSRVRVASEARPRRAKPAKPSYWL